MIDQVVAILENRKVNEKYFKLAFRSRELARGVLPGQFVNIQIQPSLDPFLRRPFSYYRITGDKIEILYEILGRGTALLASRVKGDTLKVMGPLGKPFTAALKCKKRVLVAGGVGVPPLIFLAEKNPVDYFLIGTKSKKEVMPKKELAKVKGRVFYSTNDGSYGKKGYVTALLEEILKKEKPENLYIQTCGPEIMMQAVLDIARRCDIEGEASLDKPMACGVGACLGCMVKTDQGWLPSCTHGPVFKFEKLVGQI
ncbi:MAG: dihydroorotate dehydrogenase electron transfer subunit [Candidatus Omnitrophica bacterium]|nr:dihydroorotate dehydrogenase electron transfer subunit [Candidatus Omnitrophota bacterium]